MLCNFFKALFSGFYFILECDNISNLIKFYHFYWPIDLFQVLQKQSHQQTIKTSILPHV